MNIRKTVDYSAMFAALDAAVAAQLPQMELYCEIGKIVCTRSEKGSAVAAAEFLKEQYPDMTASLHAMCAGCGTFGRCTAICRNCWTKRFS